MKLKNVLIISLMIIVFLNVLSLHVFAKTVVVDVDSLRLREKASTDSEVLRGLVRGDKLEYIDEEDNWYKVKYDGVTGYVSKDFSKIQEDSTVEETPTTTVEETPDNNPTEEKPAEAPVETVEEQPVAEVKEAKLSKDAKLYILPLINANVIQDVTKETNVKILSRTNNWAYVETDEMMGWIRQEALGDSSVVSDDKDVVANNNDNNDTTTTNNDDNKVDENKSEDKEITAKTMYVNTSSIYVRKGPSTDYEIIDSLVINDTVKVTAENGDWYKVEVSGKTGYIAKRLLSDSATTTTRSSEARETAVSNQTSAPATPSSKGQQVVDYAKNYLGKKYVYGGSGPDSFDCSGFTMYVYKQFGVTLSHSATAQSKVGTYVVKENLQPGDLVFFTDYETGVGIGHVGIYVGDGNFIHASSGTGYCVKISTLTSGSYLKRYETARRVI